MENITINGLTLEVENDIAKIYNHFSSKTDTTFLIETASELIVKTFAMNYIKDILDYHQSDKIARSNWTHHTANTFFKTCQNLRFVCDFEVENRHDGAIRDTKGNIYLCAEWEIDTNTIFKPKGEIDKLYETSKKHNKADAMLFTYKIESNYTEFADKVYNHWNNLLKKDENFKLYLLTALMKKDEVENINYFYGIRILVLGNKTVDIWEDYV